ncbi:hypothetical protein ACLOJK_015517 [Asimina triloba]
MSGGDIHLPKEEEPTSIITKRVSPTPPRPRRHRFTFSHFIALAVMLVLAADGMVATQDLAFALFSLLYFCLLSKVAFPPLSPRSESPPVFKKTRLFNLYFFVSVIVSFSISIILPIGYILGGIYEGDKEGIMAAVPHVFLLSTQIFMEGVTFSCRFEMPINAFVPVFYNTRRILTIMEWLRMEMAKVDEEYGWLRRLHVGRALAMANLAFWSFNLFGFLLPVYIPLAFDMYYGQR